MRAINFLKFILFPFAPHINIGSTKVNRVMQNRITHSHYDYYEAALQVNS
jgi:hypothetical protein